MRKAYKTDNEAIKPSPFGADDVREIIEEGFLLRQPSPHFSVCIGSNWADPKKAHSNASRVLDGASICPIVDEDGVILGYVQATADGYGHPPDEDECNQIARSSNFTTSYCAESIARSVAESSVAIDLVDVVSKAAIKVHEELNPPNALRRPSLFRRDDAQCSLLVSVVLNTDGKPRVQHISVGDLSALFIDPITLVIQNVSNATEHKIRNTGDGHDSFAPETAQSVFVGKGGRADHYYFTSFPDAVTGGYLIHLTDGVTDYLDVSTSQESNKATTSIDTDTLTQLLKEKLQGSETPYSKAVITKALNELITERLIQRRQKELSEKSIYDTALIFLQTIDTDNAEKNRPQRQKYKLIDFSSEFDGICNGLKTNAGDVVIQAVRRSMKELLDMDDSDNRTFLSLWIYIKKKCPQACGDDTTITMVDVVDHQVELVRAWMECPEKRDNLIIRMKEFTQADLDHAFDVLARDKHIVRAPESSDGCYTNPELPFYGTSNHLQGNKERLTLCLGLYDDVQQDEASFSDIRDMISQIDLAKIGLPHTNVVSYNRIQDQLMAFVTYPTLKRADDFLASARTLPGKPMVWKNAVGGAAVTVGFGFAMAVATIAQYILITPSVVGCVIAALVCVGIAGTVLLLTNPRRGLSEQATLFAKAYPKGETLRVEERETSKKDIGLER